MDALQPLSFPANLERRDLNALGSTTDVSHSLSLFSASFKLSPPKAAVALSPWRIGYSIRFSYILAYLSSPLISLSYHTCRAPHVARPNSCGNKLCAWLFSPITKPCKHDGLVYLEGGGLEG